MTVARSNHAGATNAGTRVALVFVICCLFGVFSGTASGASSWSQYSLLGGGLGGADVALGFPSGISCWSANRCLLTTTGGLGSSSGAIFAFNGDKQGSSGGWRLYSHLCASGPGQVVWAGPTEFWTITTPSDPFDDALHVGVGLCHFKDGSIVGSYSTSRAAIDSSSDPIRKMVAGACRSQSDCWFAGDAAVRPDGTDPGTFNLHWDGSKLTTVYAPARRGASDIVATSDGYAESVFAGPDSSETSDPTLLSIPPYRPVQKISAGGTDETAFTASGLLPSVPGFGAEATEILAIDNGLPGAPGPMLWAVGGGAASGPAKDQDLDYGLPGDDTPADTGVFAAYRDSDGAAWHQLSIVPDDVFTINTRLVDVAAIPGTHQAIAAVRPDNQYTLSAFGPAPSQIALLDADAGTVTLATIGDKGSVEQVECVDADNCWAATADGWLLHRGDPAAPTPIDSSVFPGTVDFRPNEVAEQALSDSANDDSQLFAPSPDPEPEAQKSAKVLKAAVGKVRTQLKGNRLIFRFKTIRKVRVTVTAKLHGRVVAKKQSKMLRPGRHTLVLRLNPKRWPTKIAMSVKEPKLRTSATISGFCLLDASCK